MSLAVRQLHPLFAAELIGADLTEPPSSQWIDTVEEAMAQHAVLVIREQIITDEDHIRFSRAFGPLELPPNLGTQALKGRLRAELYDASNLDEHGRLLTADSPRRRYNRGNELFHTDSSFNDLPTKWSLLLAHTLPVHGGNTEFIDTRAVYDDLSDELKATAEPLQAVHYLWHSRERGGFTDVSPEMLRAMPPVQHPLVRTLPNGRRALYIGAHAAHIIGWPTEEGARLLQQLAEIAAQPKYIYSHEWRNGDLVIWDNRCTLHRVTAFDDLSSRRDLRRTTINEYGPERASTDRDEALPD